MSARAALRAFAVLALLAAWEGVRRLGLVGALILASPSEIAIAAVQHASTFAGAFGITILEIAAALTLAAGVGVTVGVVVGTQRFATAVSAPLLSSLFAVPLITWYPLFMVWFGIGSPSKIAYGAVSAFLPIAINTIDGFRGLDPNYATFGRAVGCSRRQIVWRILFPLALPSIVAGLRIGTALAVIGVVVAEMLASRGGIGYVITESRNLYEVGNVYFGILLAVLCALLANAVFTRIQRRFTHWRS